MGSYEENQIHCAACQRLVLARRQVPNHVLHAILTLFSCGAWALVWAALTLTPNFVGRDMRWRCTVCGTPAASLASTGSATLNSLRTTKPWQWMLAASLAGLVLLGAMSQQNKATKQRTQSATSEHTEIVERTLPLELGEGDLDAPIAVHPADGSAAIQLPPGTRIEQLKPRGTPPRDLIAPRRVRVLSGPYADLIAWTSGTQVQAARKR